MKKPYLFRLGGKPKGVAPKAHNRKQAGTARNTKKEDLSALKRAVRSAAREWEKLTPAQKAGYL